MMFEKDTVYKKEFILFSGALLVLGGIFLISSISGENQGEQVMCTADAMQCSDGSYVGRTGPDCKFVCPVDNDLSGVPSLPWQATTTLQGLFSFQYPEKFLTKYMTPIDWPPKLSMSSQPFTCTQVGSEVEKSGKTELRVVNGKEYCRTIFAEGAAGSVYKNYAYSMSTWDKVLTLTFSTKEVQCMNYDEIENLACQLERDAFNTDGIADRIFSSVKENVI